MLIPFPYNYINLLAFITILKYENKREININTLEKYRTTLLEEVIKDYNCNETIYSQPIDCWEGKIDFYFNPNDDINNFLNEFSDLFYIDEDTIYLYDDVSHDDLINREIMLREIEDISSRFQSASNNSSVLDVLNVSTIKSIIDKYVICENQIEKNYSKISHDADNNIKEKIKEALSIREKFLNIICQKEDYIIDAFRIQATRLLDNVDDYIKPPLDLELWKQSSYCKKSEDEIGDIEDRIYDMFQYAIFSKSGLSSLKIQSMLENLYFNGDSKKSHSKDIDDEFFDDFILDEEIEDDGIYYIANMEEIDLGFCMIYLNKLNDYMKKYGETPDLIETKNRLLYALDMPILSLYEEENFKEQLEESKNLEFEEDDFEFIVDEVRFMADEVFMTPQDKNTIKKLLFISTYYEITKDKKIIEILTKHSNHKDFSLYIEIILGNQPGYFKRILKI